jgi:hypothetical protein
MLLAIECAAERANRKGQSMTKLTHNAITSTSATTTDAQTSECSLTVDQWLAIRKEAGLTIDPETAEVWWTYAQTLDPYGVYPDLPEECQQIGREYFARSPGNDIWVSFHDLPRETREALWKKHDSVGGLGLGLEAANKKEWPDVMGSRARYPWEC